MLPSEFMHVCLIYNLDFYSFRINANTKIDCKRKSDKCQFLCHLLHCAIVIFNNSMVSIQHLQVDKSQNIIVWYMLTPFIRARRACVWGSLWGSTDRCWKRQLCLCWSFSSSPQLVCWSQAGNTSVQHPPLAWHHFPPHAVRHMRGKAAVQWVKNTLISREKKIAF